MILAETVVEAEGLPVVQVAPADESLSPLSCLPVSTPSPPPAAPERLPGGSLNASPAFEPPAEGTVGGPSTSERLPEETVGGSPVSSPSRSTRSLVVARTPPTRCLKQVSRSGPPPIGVNSSLSMNRRKMLRWRSLRNLFL